MDDNRALHRPGVLPAHRTRRLHSGRAQTIRLEGILSRTKRSHNRWQHWGGRLAQAAALATLVALVFGAMPGLLALHSYQDRIYTRVEKVPAAPVAIVFGAAVRNGVPTPMLADRVSAAVQLYKAGKVQRLLMTGDNSRPDYDEVTAMKRQAVAEGVPADKVNLDYAGFRTYDSCYRAKAVFGIAKAILVTQGYHLPRALFLANSLGIDAVGFKAGRDDYGGQAYYDAREAAALVVSWYEVNVTHPLPRFLGEPVNINKENRD